MSKNLMVGSHKYTNAEYSKNYERIKWKSSLQNVSYDNQELKYNGERNNDKSDSDR